MSSSASSLPSQRKREINVASARGRRRTRPALAFVAASVPAKPSATGCASRVTESRVAGSAASKRATSTSSAAMRARESGVAAKGVSVASAVTAVARRCPSAATAKSASVPFAENIRRGCPGTRRRLRRVQRCGRANGATAPSSALAASVPKPVTKRSLLTVCCARAAVQSNATPVDHSGARTDAPLEPFDADVGNVDLKRQREPRAASAPRRNPQA